MEIGMRGIVLAAVAIQIVFALPDGGGWRCSTTSLQPVDFGVALSGP
jgi:hypothetical protein